MPKHHAHKVRRHCAVCINSVNFKSGALRVCALIAVIIAFRSSEADFLGVSPLQRGRSPNSLASRATSAPADAGLARRLRLLHVARKHAATARWRDEKVRAVLRQSHLVAARQAKLTAALDAAVDSTET